MQRINSLRARLPAARMDCLFVFSLPNIFYLTGFTGSAGVLLVEEGRATLFTDGRYALQAREEVKSAKVVITRTGALKAAARRARRHARAGFEAGCGYRTWCTLAELLGARRLRPADGLVEELRMVKEDSEIESIREAVETNSRVFDEVVPLIKPGVTELDIAAELEYRMRRYGGERPAFETIAAAGWRSALPHARAGSRPLGKNEFLVLDHGVILGHYASDMTRTVYLGTADRRARTLYGVVQEAQQRAIEAVRAGVACSVVDRAARGHIARCGFDQLFTHSTGHGLGIEVHEGPRVAARETTKLPAGSVITIEPGVYVPDYGGVRIEDVVVVRERGAEVLTRTPKHLLEL